jgi:hypothetical protein
LSLTVIMERLKNREAGNYETELMILWTSPQSCDW